MIQNFLKINLKKFINKNKYNFPLENNILSNIITKWKNITNKMNKTIIIYDKFNYINRLIFRDYRICMAFFKYKRKPIEIEYCIWE